MNQATLTEFRRVAEVLAGTPSALLIALETLREIRDAKASAGIDHQDAWYEGYARQKAADAISLIEALGRS